MITIKEIFNKFEMNSAYTFATIRDGYPETRIAHLLTYDEDGLYFQTMKVKPFYNDLSTSNKVSICSLVVNQGAVTHDIDGLPQFEPGFFIKASGDVSEVSFEELELKAKKDKKFIPLIKDIQRYPTMTTFVLTSFNGEVYNYDFAMKNMDHKILRERFAFGNAKYIESGFTIADNCVGCSLCQSVCTFKAITKGTPYKIDPRKCDECGSCYTICPANAVIPKVQMNNKDKKEAKIKLTHWLNNK